MLSLTARKTVTIAAVALTGWFAAGANAHQLAPASAACKVGYYKNSSGNCIHSPAKAPAAPVGASAKCRDGSYSFSAHRSGTCSYHGGVATWL